MPDQNLPQVSAQGTLGKTPFPHLLVYVLERQLSGTMELSAPDGERATLLVINGAPSKIRLGEPLAYLGHVLLEEGMISEEQLQQSAQKWAERKAQSQIPVLHGTVMRELGILDENSLREGLRRQLVHKCEHLLNWPGETRFDYYDQFDALAAFGAPAEVTIDPLPLVWSAIRQFPSWDHANGALTKLGSAGIRISPHAVIDRLDLGPSEMALVEELRVRPMRLADLTATKHASPSVTQLFIYCLLITKQVDLVHDEALMAAPMVQQGSIPAPGISRPAPPLSAPPAPASSSSMPSAPPPSSSAPFSVSGNISSPQGPSTQVARVQLSKGRPASLPSAMIEERAPIMRIDGRIATPMPGPINVGTGDLSAAVAAAAAQVAAAKSIPQAPPAPSPESLGQAAAPIAAQNAAQNAAQSLGPNSTRHGAPPSIRGAALSSSMKAVGGEPPSSKKELTPEQAAFRQKIVDRASRVQKENYFEMLGLTKDATDTEIKMAFIGLAKEWHPDRLPAALLDVKPEVSRIFSHLGEAHTTLTDPMRRAKYMNLLKDGGATPEDQDIIARVVEATTDFQKAEHYLKRNEWAQAEEWARKAMNADPEQADYGVMVAWLEAQKVENQHEDKTLEHIGVMTAALKKNARNEKALYYRAQLYRRMNKNREAIADYRQVVELNPRNIDAARELRLYNMRRTTNSSLPPGPGRTSSPPTSGTKAGDIFGKLFKK